MIHHDSRPLNVALAEATGKFERIIANGPTKMIALLNSIEKNTPIDRVVKGDRVRFDDEMGLVLDDTTQDLHPHALGQLCDRMGSGVGPYIRKLMEEPEGNTWARELAAANLNKLVHNRAGGERFLLRSVDSEVRGWLSNSYRRLDVRPIAMTFLEAIQQLGCVPYDAFSTPTKLRARVVMPEVYKMHDDSPMLFGLELGNSDFGDGKLSLKVFILRMWCTNLATTEDTLSQVHLGKRLGDDVEFSERTYRLDTETSVSMVKDLTASSLSKAKVEATIARIKAAAETQKEFSSFKGSLTKLLGKGELEQAEKLYNTCDDVQILPPVKSAWRMSNVLSWLANAEEDMSRRVLLQEKAGELIQA